MNEKLFEKTKTLPFKKTISQTQFIAYGFFLIIMTGSLLLMLPIASRDGQSEPFLNCLFTATSASLRDGAGGGRYLDPVEPVRPGGAAGADSAGGLGFISIGISVYCSEEENRTQKERGLCRKASTPCRLAAW